MRAGDSIADRYVVLRPLGEGGLATTFLVRDRAYDAEVALKLVAASDFSPASISTAAT